MNAFGDLDLTADAIALEKRLQRFSLVTPSEHRAVKARAFSCCVLAVFGADAGCHQRRPDRGAEEFAGAFCFAAYMVCPTEVAGMPVIKNAEALHDDNVVPVW